MQKTKISTMSGFLEHEHMPEVSYVNTSFAPSSIMEKSHCFNGRVTESTRIPTSFDKGMVKKARSPLKLNLAQGLWNMNERLVVFFIHNDMFNLL